MYKIIECFKCNGKGYLIVKVKVISCKRASWERAICDCCDGVGIIKVLI